MVSHDSANSFIATKLDWITRGLHLLNNPKQVTSCYNTTINRSALLRYKHLRVLSGIQDPTSNILQLFNFSNKPWSIFKLLDLSCFQTQQMWVFFSLNISTAYSVVLICKTFPVLHKHICKFMSVYETYETNLLCTTIKLSHCVLSCERFVRTSEKTHFNSMITWNTIGINVLYFM